MLSLKPNVVVCSQKPQPVLNRIFIQIIAIVFIANKIAKTKKKQNKKIQFPKYDEKTLVK